MSKNLHLKCAKCRGCRDNFYNGNGSYCWSLDSAKVVYRWRINMWTPMDSRKSFAKVRVYDCYHGEGNQRDIYMKQLPAHLGGDWADAKEKEEVAP